MGNNNSQSIHLKKEILARFSSELVVRRLRIPYTRMSEYTRIKKYATEYDFRYLDDCVQLTVRIPQIYLKKFVTFYDEN